ncbi:hypothetical protein X740_28450 [Mesorhizobium sp. LNHC221B00]|nr:hypothetical protein X740_28450 [Mesorhizobium sp. LNHC221B00]
MLDLARTPQRLDRASKLRKDCLFDAREDTTGMFYQQPIKDLPVRRGKCSNAPLILACRPDFAGQFCRQNCNQSWSGI